MALTTNNTHKFQSGELVTADKLNNTKVVQTGTTSDHSSFTGSQGQVTFNTTTNKLVVHDGTTAGGNALQNSADAVSLGAGSIDATNLATGAVTEPKIANNAVTTNKINNNAVTENKIANNAVTTNKLADGAVTSAKLSNTGVTAGSYTHSSITVDAKGRITSASSGSSSGGGGSTATTVVAGTWNSGWVNADPSGTAVANGATLLFAHNLGTTDVTVEIFMAHDANGTNGRKISSFSHGSSLVGGSVSAITTSEIFVQLHSQTATFNVNGSLTTQNWGAPFYSHIKVVVGAGGSGGLPGSLIPITRDLISSTINVSATATHQIREYIQTDSNNQSGQTHGATGTTTVNANNYPLVRVGGTNFPEQMAILFNIPEEARWLRYRVKMTNGKLIYNDFMPGNYIDSVYRDTTSAGYNQAQVAVGMSEFSFVVHRQLRAKKAVHAYSNSYGSGTNSNADIDFTYWEASNGISNRFLFESYSSSVAPGTLETLKLEGYYL